MNPDQARFLADVVLQEIEWEMNTTRRVLAAVPDGKGDYTPDAKSMNALTLAFHIAQAEVAFLDAVAARSFAFGEPGLPSEIKRPSDVVAWYDAHRCAALDRVKAMTGEQLATPVDFFGMLKLPVVRYLSLSMRHIVHHRGQLSAYLRPMGAKVPSIFGPSADEPLPA